MLYKTLSLLLIIAALGVPSNQSLADAGSVPVKWAVEKNSSLGIDGQSNINSFSCSIDMHAGRDTIVFSNDNSKSVKLTGDMDIDVAGFDCQSPLITKDLRKTLKSEEYPRMTIRFLSLQSMPEALLKPEFVKGMVEVELAGVTRRFQVDYSALKVRTGYIILNGSHHFSFSDFKLSPPQKLGGLIKIKDDFAVNFQLILRAV